MKTLDVAKVQDAFRQVLLLLKVTETPQEIGYRQSVEAEWFYALGPRFRTRALAILREVSDLSRSRNPLQYSDRLQQLVPEMAWLETKAKAQSEGGEKHGPFTLYVMPGVSRKDIGEAKAALDQAVTLIHKHFPKVLYGDVYFTPAVSSGLAQYVPGKDVLYLGMKAKKSVGDVHAICHEFGHRYFHRFWRDADAKNIFRHLTQDTVYEEVVLTPAEKKALTQEYIKAVQAAKAGRKQPMSPALEGYLIRISKQDQVGFDILRGAATQVFQGKADIRDLEVKFLEIAPSSWSTDKVVREPLFVTPYAKSKRADWGENFAEAFAHFVMGKPLAAELQAIMELLP